MSGKLLILCGSARAGKSTYAKAWMTSYETLPKVIVNADNVRLAMHGQRYNALAEPLVHSVTEIMVRTLYKQGMFVCVDETSTTPGSFRKWFKIDPQAEVYFVQTDIDECKRRAYASGQPDLVELGVIDRHFDNLIALCNYKIPEWCRIKLVKQIRPTYLYDAVEKIRLEVQNAR